MSVRPIAVDRLRKEFEVALLNSAYQTIIRNQTGWEHPIYTWLEMLVKHFERAAEAIARVLELDPNELTRTYWKWKNGATLEKEAQLVELCSNDEIRISDSILTVKEDSPEYAVLRTGRQMVDDKWLLMRAWLPALSLSEELVLLVRFEVPHDKPVNLSLEVAPTIQNYLEAVRLTLHEADRASKQSSLQEIARASVSVVQDLAEASEKLLYLELWRQLAAEAIQTDQQRSSSGPSWVAPLAAVDLRAWLGEPIPLGDQFDALLAVFLSSRLYLAHHGSEDARSLLRQCMPDIDGESRNSHIIRLSRGPFVEIKPTLERSWCVAIQALAHMSNDAGRSEEVSHRLKMVAEVITSKTSGNTLDELNPSWLHLLATQAHILQDEAARASKRAEKAKPTSIEDLKQLVGQAREIARDVGPFLIYALQHPPSDAPLGHIELSSRWLEGWFGLRLPESSILTAQESVPVGLESDSMSEEDTLDRADPLWVIEIVRCWAIYYGYLIEYFVQPRLFAKTTDLGLPGSPTQPADDTVDRARLTLLCEWAHHNGVPRTIPLQAWLTKTYESEFALYALSGKGTYRQHLFHVQDLCLLGCALLYSRLKTSDREIRYVELLAETAVQEHDDLFANWLVAALLHDLGYALQVVPRGLDALSAGVSKGTNDLVAEIRSSLERAPGRLADYDPTPARSLNRLEVADHAHASVATLVSHLRELLDDGETASRFNPAAAAIVEHDSKDPILNFRTDPLAALIVICDQLQDWGRPRVDASTLARKFLAQIRSSPEDRLPPIDIKQLFPSSRLFIEAEFSESGELSISTREDNTSVIRFLLTGPEAGANGYEPAVAWLDACRAFQRITLEQTDGPSEAGKLPGFRVRLQHQVARDGLLEIHRLARFAEDNPEQRGGLKDWLTAVRHLNRGIKHGYPQTAPGTEMVGKEWIEFRIPELWEDGRRPLKATPPKLYRSYREFREKQERKVKAGA